MKLVDWGKLRVRKLLMMVVVGCLATGCAVVKVKPEGRVASDQLLISMAIEDAVKQLDLSPAVAGRDVSLSVAAYMGDVKQDLNYVERALEARILQAGGRVSAAVKNPDREVVAMVQTVGSDQDSAHFSVPIPIPALGSVAISELTFYSDNKQIARCRLWLFAKNPDGSLAWSHQPVHVAHRIRNPTLLGITLGKASDLKELDHGKGTVPIKDYGLAPETPQ